MRLSNEFSPIVEENADTLVYLGIPPQQPGQDSHSYEYIQLLFERPYLMKSDTLRRINSLMFEKFLGPMSARTERKLKKLGLHKLVERPERLKYYVDLSPVLNDDEALIQVTELTVPRGALKWHQIAKDYCVDPDQVCGRDTLDLPIKAALESFIAEQQLDYAKLIKEATQGEENVADEEDNDQTNAVAEPTQKQTSPYDLPEEEEYSSLRHHTTVARLLYAIAGKNPKLNSAAKMWSFCMLAKYFDCAQSNTINHWVEGWLLQGRNNSFIQINPSITYRIATAIQSIWLMRCSFAVLVGKKAILNANSAARTMFLSRNNNIVDASLFQCLDDDEINRIDHAAISLHQRVKSSFTQIIEGAWMGMSPDIKQLIEMRLDDHDAQRLREKLKRDLLSYVQGRICASITDWISATARDKDDERVFTSIASAKVYNELRTELRILTQDYWAHLKNIDFTTEHSVEADRLAQVVQHLKGLGLLDLDFKLDYVSSKAIVDLVYQLNCARFPGLYPESHSSRKYTDTLLAKKPAVRLRDTGSDAEIDLPLRTRKHSSIFTEGFAQEVQEIPLPPNGLDLPELVLPVSTHNATAQAFRTLTSEVDGTNATTAINSPNKSYRGKRVLQEVFQDELRRAQAVSSPSAAQTSQGNIPHEIGTYSNLSDPDNDLIYAIHSLNGLNQCIRRVIPLLLTPGYEVDGTFDFEIPMNEVNTLLCLDENEWKYLPLWAGGLDDGSGGVFNDGVEIPDAPDVLDGGFRGGAMGIIPGVGSSLGGSIAGSEFEDIGTEVGISTVGKASRNATDGTATVISLDE